MRKTLVKTEDYLKILQTPQGSATIYSKEKRSRLEINIYEMKKGFTLYFQPPSTFSGIKTYWILEGKIFSIQDEVLCDIGSLIVLEYGDEPYHFNTLEETKVLVHSIDEDSFEQTKSNFNAIHQVLTQIQSKDSYTLDHSFNVHHLVEKMGVVLGYKGKRMLNLLLSAQYHDIGKIKIPNDILNKPSSLTNEEFEVMKTHVSEGRELIEESFSSEVYEIVVQHHERYDGSGYPRGLLGKNILEEARIIGICDSFDAMTSDRIYKKGKSFDGALAEIKALSGILYDPDLVEIFEKIVTSEDFSFSNRKFIGVNPDSIK